MQIHFDKICEQYVVNARPKNFSQSADPCEVGWRSVMTIVFDSGVEVTGIGEAGDPICAIKDAFEDAVKRYLLRHTPEKVALTGEVLETVR